MGETYCPAASLLKGTSPAIAFIIPHPPFMTFQSELVKFACIVPWNDWFPYTKAKAWAVPQYQAKPAA